MPYSKEEMMGINNRQYTDKAHLKKLFTIFNEVYRTGHSTKEFDWRIIRKDGTKRYMELSVSLQKNSAGKPIGFQGIYRDITARKQSEEEKRSLEDRLNRSEKMEALGKLAGGVAHDLNNVLGILSG